MFGVSKQKKFGQNNVKQGRTQQDVLRISKVNNFHSFNSFFESKKSMVRPTVFLLMGLVVIFGLLGLINLTSMNFVFALPENVTDVEGVLYITNCTTLNETGTYVLNKRTHWGERFINI